MIKNIFFSATALLLITTITNASQILTAPLNGHRLNFVSEAGTSVKKGEPLVKYHQEKIEAYIKKAQAALDAAQDNLKNAEIDYKRYHLLKQKDSVSAEKLEDTDLAYDKAVLDVAERRAELLAYKNELELAAISAPYDCRIIRNFLAPNSGTEYGLDIMEIASDTPAVSDKAQSASSGNVRTLTSAMYGGVITYTAQEGSIVKKGDLLVRMYDHMSIYAIDALNAAITFAEHNLQDKESKYKRYTKLRHDNATSISDFENTELALDEAKYRLADAKLDLIYLKDYNDSVGNVVAPYDCKVAKVFLIVGSGTEECTPIMELIPLPENKSPSSPDNSGGVPIGGTITVGYPIVELPEEGAIVKKDEPLVKYCSAQIEEDMVQLALDYAKKAGKDKEQDYKRCKYLTDNNSNSKESCEDSELSYKTALNSIKEYEAALAIAKERVSETVIKAPYDCKVTKVLLVPGSGTTYGLPILEIEKH